MKFTEKSQLVALFLAIVALNQGDKVYLNDEEELMVEEICEQVDFSISSQYRNILKHELYKLHKKYSYLTCIKDIL